MTPPDDTDRQAPDKPASRWRFALPVGLTLAASALTGIAADGWASRMRGNWPAWLMPVAEQVTSLGKSGWILVGSALIGGVALAATRPTALSTPAKAMARRVAGEAVTLFAAVAIAGITANLMKRAIGRARPAMAEDWGVLGFSPFSGARFESFPSGHSTTAGALVASLALIWPRFTIPLLLAGAAIALSRVIVGAHYPSDVVAGFGYGIWWAVLVRHWMRERGILSA